MSAAATLARLPLIRHVLPQVNLPSSGDFYSVSIQAANQKFFDQLMCIESSQNPNLGSQYSGEAWCRVQGQRKPPAGRAGLCTTQ